MIPTRWAVAGVAGLVLLYRFDLPAVLCITGAILNALLSKILKRVMNQARPLGAQLHDPGMPSSHAQSLFFFASYLAIAVVREEWMEHKALDVAAAISLFALATFLAAKRVAKGLHTWEQVAVGAAIGGCVGAGWLVGIQPIASGWLKGSHLRSLEPMVVLLFGAGAAAVGSIERKLSISMKRESI